MKKFVLLLISAVILTSFHAEKDWKKLLDNKLTHWETYESYRLMPGYKGEVPRDENGNEMAPIGYNRNVANVFTVEEENEEPVLHITGEIYGCVFTRGDFNNYHLKLKVKWGKLKWDPRKNEPMDSGILYHSQGECGVDYWKAWMLSHEFQIMEHSFGDYWSIASSHVTVKAASVPGTSDIKFDGTSPSRSIGSGTGNPGYCQAGGDYELAMGEWNTVELICFDDKSVYIVNGHVVNALSKLGYDDHGTEKPLTHGKIQLQSEAAEVYYKDIEIRNIDSMPKEFEGFF